MKLKFYFQNNSWILATKGDSLFLGVKSKFDRIRYIFKRLSSLSFYKWDLIREFQTIYVYWITTSDLKHLKYYKILIWVSLLIFRIYLKFWLLKCMKIFPPAFSFALIQVWQPVFMLIHSQGANITFEILNFDLNLLSWILINELYLKNKRRRNNYKSIWR